MSIHEPLTLPYYIICSYLPEFYLVRQAVELNACTRRVVQVEDYETLVFFDSNE